MELIYIVFRRRVTGHHEFIAAHTTADLASKCVKAHKAADAGSPSGTEHDYIIQPTPLIGGEHWNALDIQERDDDYSQESPPYRLHNRQ